MKAKEEQKNVLNDKDLEKASGGFVPWLEEISKPVPVDKISDENAGIDHQEQNVRNKTANK